MATIEQDSAVIIENAYNNRKETAVGALIGPHLSNHTLIESCQEVRMLHRVKDIKIYETIVNDAQIHRILIKDQATPMAINVVSFNPAFARSADTYHCAMETARFMKEPSAEGMIICLPWGRLEMPKYSLSTGSANWTPTYAIMTPEQSMYVNIMAKGINNIIPGIAKLYKMPSMTAEGLCDTFDIVITDLVATINANREKGAKKDGNSGSNKLLGGPGGTNGTYEG